MDSHREPAACPCRGPDRRAIRQRTAGAASLWSWVFQSRRTSGWKRSPAGPAWRSQAWSTVRREIANHLKEDPGCLATTMVDYYGMPETGPRAWPGRLQATRHGSSSERASTVEDALSKDIAFEMGSDFDQKRFIAYVAMHEFEALLFSDCDRFGQGIGRPELTHRFQEIRDQFASPEEIDDSPDTAPSKRVAELVPGYQKPLMGSLASIQVGLDAIRSACPHFRRWLELAGTPPGPNG